MDEIACFIAELAKKHGGYTARRKRYFTEKVAQDAAELLTFSRHII